MKIYSLDVLLSLFRTSLCFLSSSNCCFLTCIHISQETGQVVWYPHLLKNFPQFVVIHTVKGFVITQSKPQGKPMNSGEGSLSLLHWIIEKARVFQKKTSISALLTMPKPLTVRITTNCGKFLKRWEYQTTLPAS